MTATPIVRRIQPEDVLGCIDTFYVALDDLYARFDQPPLPREPAALQRLIQHLIDTDGERCWLAEEPSSTADPSAPLVLGFGAAALREGAWFLSLLFVRPHAQKAGLGRRLLLETFPRGKGSAIATMMPGATVPVGADFPGMSGAGSSGGRIRTFAGRPSLSTCVEALQPISTGLYASYGIVPRVPLFSAVGEPRPGAFPPLPAGIEALPFEQVAQSALARGLDGLDRTVLGYARPADHDFWRDERRRGVLFRARGGNELLGYGYTQASGRLGPVAVRDAELMTAVLGALFTRESPRGAWLAVVPGTNEGAMVSLLRSGFRLEGWPGIISSTSDVGFLARYLPASFALL